MPSGIIERLASSAHCKDNELVNLALFLRLHPLVRIVGRVRTIAPWNYAGDLAGDVRDFEMVNFLGTALAVEQTRPGRLHAAAKRRKHSQPCDDDTSHTRLRAKLLRRCIAQLNSQSGEAIEPCPLAQLFAFFSRNLTASPTVRIVSAASSGISQPNSSSKAITSSTVSRLSAPRSSMKLA